MERCLNPENEQSKQLFVISYITIDYKVFGLVFLCVLSICSFQSNAQTDAALNALSTFNRN